MRALALIPALLFSSVAAAAEFRSTEDMQYWTPTFIHLPRRGRLSALLEINPRVRGDLGRLNHLLIRPWLGWSVSKGVVAHAGYAWVRNDLGAVSQEHRIWQQGTFLKTVMGSTLLGRARLEERWLEGARGLSWRGRIMGRVERPIGNGPWFLVGSDELFLHLPSAPGGPAEGFDQNRLFLGVGRMRSGRPKAEFGYQHWRLNRPSGPDSIFHVLVLTTHWTID